MNQVETLLRIEYQTQKNSLSLLIQAMPVEKMQSGVQRHYEAKMATVVALEVKMRGGSN